MATYPIILYDSVFNYGTPTATDTATDYSVLNIKDYRSYTFWKGTGAGTDYLTINTLLGTNMTFDSDTSSWTASNCTLASIAGGQSGNCLEVTRTGGTYQYAYQDVSGFKIGQTYYYSAYVKSGASGDDAYQLIVRDAATYKDALSKSGTTSGSWVQVTDTFVATNTTLRVYCVKYSDTARELLFDEIAIYPYIAVNKLGIAYHNLGYTNGCYASISVESSTDNSSWTERLAAFTLQYNTPILKAVTETYAPYWRVKIVTVATAPYLAVCLLGSKITFPSIPRSPHNLWTKGKEVITEQSKTGYILGSTLKYKPITLSYSFPPAESNYTWWTATFKTFWNDHAVYMKPFFFALDLTNYSTEAYWVTMEQGQEYALNMALTGRVEDMTLTMKGLYEL